MSVALVKEEIENFLKSKDPAEVLCIRGKWGIGKTYAWNDCLDKMQRARLLNVKYYSYVSIFGINSSDELKSLIFENKHKLTLSDPTGCIFVDRLLNHFQKHSRKYINYIRTIPFL
jgi:hypothetical protein